MIEKIICSILILISLINIFINQSVFWIVSPLILTAIILIWSKKGGEEDDNTKTI